MAIIKPFKALRPKTNLAKQVASRPYDVLNSEEARTEAANNSFSFLHVTKSEIDLPAGTDIHSKAVYEKAKENLDQFVHDDVLFYEQKPCYYIYRLIMKKKYRNNQILAIKAQNVNIFIAYKDVDDINEMIN